MSRISALSHVSRRADGVAEAAWRGHVLRTAFQPIFAFSGDETQKRGVEIVAYEGLLRPFVDGQPLRPDRFFRSLGAGDRDTVETIARTLHLLNAGACLAGDSVVFVNFDPSLFSDQRSVARAVRDLRIVQREAGLKAEHVVCEVTEQPSLAPDALASFVAEVRRHGFAVAVDDFGSASSDAARIEALKPDIVKFDAAWVARLMQSASGFALLTEMVDRFAGQGIITVFEGIEEGWQLQLAEKSGAAMVQGFALARPKMTPGEPSA